MQMLHPDYDVDRRTRDTRDPTARCSSRAASRIPQVRGSGDRARAKRGRSGRWVLWHGVLAAVLPVILALAEGCTSRNPSATVGSAGAIQGAAEDYPWPRYERGHTPIAVRLPSPPGFARIPVADRSWAQWLRHLPLRAPGTPVVSRDRRVILPGDSPLVAGVVDLDVRQNQECADTILRLRAEYLRWAGRDSEIVFRLTSGDTISWPEWRRGMRPRLHGDRLRFHRLAVPDSSRGCFERFLDAAFAWCGTYSLALEGLSVPIVEARVGDFFVHPGSPGHAVLIADLARDDSGRQKALLVQGYMPPQSAHVLAPSHDGAWFDLAPGRPLHIPIWGGAFRVSELRRFAGE